MEEYIYYIDKDGRHIPGVIIDRLDSQKTKQNTYCKVRLNHPDFIRDVIRIVKTSNLEIQS